MSADPQCECQQKVRGWDVVWMGNNWMHISQIICTQFLFWKVFIKETAHEFINCKLLAILFLEKMELIDELEFIIGVLSEIFVPGRAELINVHLWHYEDNSCMFIWENAFENVIWKMTAILSYDAYEIHRFSSKKMCLKWTTARSLTFCSRKKRIDSCASVSFIKSCNMPCHGNRWLPEIMAFNGMYSARLFRLMHYMVSLIIILMLELEYS